MGEHYAKISELKELTSMLLNLLEAAQSIPEGPERRALIGTIGDFQIRLAALVQEYQEESPR
jgi:hypothetical protein